MATLIITDENGSQRTVELTGRDLRIGRSADNDLVLGDAGKGVSRLHAELRYEQGRYVVIDLNSQNGTWVNGERIQRADVPASAEVSIGSYRLRIEGATAAPGASATASATSDTVTAPEAPAATPGGTIVAPAAKAAAPSKPAKKAVRPVPGAEVKPGLIAALARLPKPVIFGGFFAIALVVIVLGQILGPSEPAPAKPTESAPTAAAGETNAQIIARHLADGKALVDKGEYDAAIRDHFDRILLIEPNHPEATDLKAKAQEKVQQQAAAAPPPAEAAPAPASTVPGAGGSASTVPAAGGQSTVPSATAAPNSPVPAAAAAPAPGAPARTGSTSSAAAGVAAARGNARGFESPVQRKPGESAQAWRTRATAIQTQYTTAKSALDRGDFAAAASGFDAILKEEPGFLDAPDLLIKAREAQRAAAQGSARDAFEAGNRLDAAGDLAGALQKYEQARAADPSIAGVEDALKRTRDKMRTQGNDAFRRARQFDALGRTADALKEYERAAQYLPADDANGKTARERVEQLKK